jgi:DNA-binding NtrC family response regulator
MYVADRRHCGGFMTDTMTRATILFVSTDAGMISAVGQIVPAMGCALQVEASLKDAARAMTLQMVDLLLVQTDAPGSDMRERLSSGFSFGQPLPVLAIARRGGIQEAVNTVRAGARDYLNMHSLGPDQIRLSVERILDQADDAVAPSAILKSILNGFITRDYRMCAACEVAAKAADSKLTLLIEGEGGTGKTLLARRIHESSARRFAPFVEVNCGTLSESLLESELFGHGRGAFTSAYRGRKGRFEMAHGGTILLDEIGSASLALQTRLLKIVESGQFERIGETHTLETDVRLVVAAKRGLKSKVASGDFREDLFHRLNSLVVRLLPLRERLEDVPVLARHFLAEFSAKHHRPVMGFDDEVMARLVRYPWPGNVRELRNVVEHGVVMAQGQFIDVDSLPHYIENARPPRSKGRLLMLNSLREAMREPERRCLLEALELAGWNKQYAARKLHISRSTLYKKIKEYGLDQDQPEALAAMPGEAVRV